MSKKKSHKKKQLSSEIMRKGLPLSEFNLLSGLIDLTPEDHTLGVNELANRFFSIEEEYNRVKVLVTQEALEYNLTLLQGLTAKKTQAKASEAKEEDLEDLEETKKDQNWKPSIKRLEIGIEDELKFRPSEGVDPLEIMLGKRVLISHYFNLEHILKMEPAPLLVSSVAAMISSEKLNQLINLMQQNDTGALEEILADKSQEYPSFDKSSYFKVIKNILGNKETAALKLLKEKTTPYSELEKDSLEIAARFGKSKVTSYCLDKLIEGIEQDRAILSNLAETGAQFSSYAISKIHKLNLEIIARGNIDTCKVFLRPQMWNLYTTGQQTEILATIVMRSGLDAMEILINDLMSNNLLTPEIIHQASTLALSDREEKYITTFLSPFALSLETVINIKQTTEFLQTILADNVAPKSDDEQYVLFAKIAYLYGKEKSTIDPNSFVNQNYDQLKALVPNEQQVGKFRGYFADLEIWSPAEELIGLIRTEELTNTRSQASSSKKKKAENAVEVRPIVEILADNDRSIDQRFAELSIACRGFDKKGLETFVKKNIDRLREIKPINQEEFEALFTLEPSVITGSRKLIEKINSIKLKKEPSVEKAEAPSIGREIEAMLAGDNSLVRPTAWRNHSANNQYKIFTAIIDHPDAALKKYLLDELIGESLLSSSLINRAIEDGRSLDPIHRRVSIIERIKRSSREPADILVTSGNRANRFAELAYVMNDQSESSAKKFIMPRLKQFQELIPENSQEFEQLFIDKTIITGSRKLLKMIDEVAKDLIEKQETKARSKTTAVRTGKQKDISEVAEAKTTAKTYKIAVDTNFSEIDRKAPVQPNPIVQITEPQPKDVTPTVSIAEDKLQHEPLTAPLVAEVKEVKQKATTIPFIEDVKEIRTSNAAQAMNIQQPPAQPTPLQPQFSQQISISREAIIQEMQYLSNIRNSVDSRLALLANSVGYPMMQSPLMVTPPAPLQQSLQSQTRYLNQLGQLIIEEIQHSPQLGLVAIARNQYTGEMSQRSLEPGGWANQVRPGGVSATNNVAQILQQGPRNETSFKEAEDKRKQSGRDSLELER